MSSCSIFEDDEEATPPQDNQQSAFPNEFTITKLEESVTLDSSTVFSASHNSSDVVWESSDDLIVTVDDNGIIRAKSSGTAEVTATLGNETKSFTVNVNNTGKTISGQVRYEDWGYDKNGLTTLSYKPVRYALVNLLDLDGGIIESSETTEAGTFNFGNVIFSGYQIEVQTWVKNEVASNFVVKDMNEAIYSVVKSANSDSENNNLDISYESGAGGAFNILDVMTTSAQFSSEELGVQVQDLNIFWESNNYLGTYFCSGYDQFDCINGSGIYVLNVGPYPGYTALDTDEYDDDVLMHEYGHYLVETFAKDDSPGGCHNLTDNNLDLRLAWSEGLGTFFPVAIKDWMKRNHPTLMSMSATEDVTLYLDTWQTKALNHEPIISFDIANFDDNDPNYPENAFYYGSSEVAILKILWGMSQTFGMSRVWDVVENYFSTSQFPTNLAVFWDGFLSGSQYQAAELDELKSIFNERRVFYQDDMFEMDNDMASATAIDVNGQLSDHYLYKKPTGLDVDFFELNLVAGKTYQISTKGLRNGVDTKIRLFDTAGEVLIIDGETMENDDAFPGAHLQFDESCGLNGSKRIYVDESSLASRLSFTAETSDLHYVEVKYHNKFRPDDNFTGHYGSYQLEVIELQ